MRLMTVIAACGVVVGAACGGGEDPLEPPPGPPVASAGVSVSDNFFGPATVRLSVGGTVTWTWNGNVAHNINFTSGTPRPPGTPTAQTSGTYVATFGTIGQYNYNCTLHAGMRGAIFVE